LEVGSEPIIAYGNQDHLMQVCINILNNAADAVSESAEKKINVRLCDLGDMIDIEFSDGGTGIDLDILPKIFDEYFTTKEGNGGTGLGLYISKCMVEEFGGNMSVKNNDSGGATFTVRLPKNKRETS